MTKRTEAAPIAAQVRKSRNTRSRAMEKSMERVGDLIEVTRRLGLKFGGKGVEWQADAVKLRIG